MATFGKPTFNAAIYSSFRPSYPKALFLEIFEYHRNSKHAKWDLAVDLGCGTGQATTEIQLSAFEKVIGVDPSLPMIQAAREIKRNGLWDAQADRIQFVQSEAENLGGILPDNSVDLLISAQAAHWFDWKQMWPEAGRVLRSGGTAAFWTYAELRLKDFPSTSPMITAYAQGTDPMTSLGPHFQRPGRTILENLFRDIPDPRETLAGDGFADFQRVYFTGSYYPDIPQAKAVIMEKEMRWRVLLGYFRTWSSLHKYHTLYPDDLKRHDERFPEDLEQVTKTHDRLVATSNREEGETGDCGNEDITVEGGDIAVRFWKDLREEVKSQGGRFGVDEPIVVEWPMALLLAKKS